MLNYGAQQAERQQPGPVQHRVLGDAGDRLPRRPQGRDARPRGRPAPSFAARQRHRDARVPARPPASAGIEAATNIVVRQAWLQMLFCVYARGGRAVLHHLPQLARRAGGACVPLALDLDPVRGADGRCWASGVKVATLPVIALGVGIGVDYALYLLSVAAGTAARRRCRSSRPTGAALQFTGKVVVLVGVTLARGRGHLGVVADQVPGRHGHPARVHVPRGTCSAR
ncbi:MAG: hypothetical protein MZU91_12075 [Desulfosudis oleivorans]|nr:hypothetical protein [Desulfosudis oleivorans]